MATRKAPARKNEIRIKEDELENEEYFHRQSPDIIPPELNLSIRDGFRFGIGFILSTLILYVILAIGAIGFAYLLPMLHLR